jgi:hypothetical protein
LIDSNKDGKSKWFYITNHPGAAEAQREAAEAPARVEYGADDVGGYLATRAAAEDEGFEGSRAEGRTCGLQLYEEEGVATDGS